MNRSADDIHFARWCVGRALRSTGQIEDALRIQEQLAEDPEDGYVQEELGECLLALHRDQESTPHFAAAYRILSDTVDPARRERLKTLGHVP